MPDEFIDACYVKTKFLQAPLTEVDLVPERCTGSQISDWWSSVVHIDDYLLDWKNNRAAKNREVISLCQNV